MEMEWSYIVFQTVMSDELINDALMITINWHLNQEEVKKKTLKSYPISAVSTTPSLFRCYICKQNQHCHSNKS